MNAPTGVAIDPAAPLVKRALNLVEDLSLTEVRAWKEANPKGLAVGYLPVYIPRPLLEAIGCLPVAVFGGGDGLDIIRGDSYFQSYICHIPRSVVEMALTGRLDCMDGMLFPSTCDVIRNLGGMWKLLYPERFSDYVDLPQTFAWERAGLFYAHELTRIAEGLEAQGALPLGPDALWDAIEADNDRCAALAELDALRVEEPWRAPASEVYAIVRAGSLMMAGAHASFVRQYIAAIRQRAGRPYDNVRVVMVGSFCEQPPLGLLRTLEKAGCDIIDDDMQLGMKYLSGPIPVDRSTDPVEALSRAFLDQGTPTSARYIGDDQKGRHLVELVQRTGADGVVFSAASFCDPALLDQPMLEAALTRASIPHTSFKFAENSGQFHTIREQAGAFSDAVKLWGVEA